MEIINNYELLAPFQNKDAGFCKWTYGTKEGKTYFLKEFLDPIYPTDESISLKIREERIEECDEYEVKKRRLYEAINEVGDGNLVRIEEFFRADNHYYISMERIVKEELSMEELQQFAFEDRILLCKTVAHSIMKLHSKHIIHADIKNSNVMIKRTKTGKLVGKIIDYDAGFFEDDPPRYEDELNGDPIYLAPEACEFMCGEPVELTCKVDVFALGILFHQYLTGEIPGYDREEYDYACDAVLDGKYLEVDKILEADYPDVYYMLQAMLVLNPEERIGIEHVYQILSERDSNDSKSDKESADSNDSENSKESTEPDQPDKKIVDDKAKWFYSTTDF